MFARPSSTLPPTKLILDPLARSCGLADRDISGKDVSAPSRVEYQNSNNSTKLRKQILTVRKPDLGNQREKRNSSERKSHSEGAIYRTKLDSARAYAGLADRLGKRLQMKLKPLPSRFNSCTRLHTKMSQLLIINQWKM